MAEVSYDVHKYRDASIVYVNMVSPNNTAHKGDWLIHSGSQVVAAASATAYYRVSALGIALMNNPTWNSQGSGLYQTAMPVGVGGVFHVSGVGSATAGFFVFPMLLGSGIVGQTGATGRAQVWTAITTLPNVSALGGSQISASAIPSSGVAKITRIIAAADPSAEWEISLFPPAIVGFLVGGVPQL